MTTVIVFNHAYNGSYCNAILSSVTFGLQKANHEVDLIRLDKDGFNPIITTQDLKGFVNRKPVDPKVIDYKERIGKVDHFDLYFSNLVGAYACNDKGGFISEVM